MGRCQQFTYAYDLNDSVVYKKGISDVTKKEKNRNGDQNRERMLIILSG